MLKALVGLLPHTGQVLLDGQDLAGQSPRERAQRIAYVPQRTRLASRLPVHVVVAQGRFAHRGPLTRMRSEDRAAVNHALRVADVEALAGRPFSELSGGEAQRVLLARALATGAGVVLLDEPTSSQDVRHALEFHAVLAELKERGAAIVACLHDLGEVRQAADHVVLLESGRVRASGNTDRIVTDEHVGDVYGVRLVEGGGLGVRLQDAPLRDRREGPRLEEASL